MLMALVVGSPAGAEPLLSPLVMTAGGRGVAALAGVSRLQPLRLSRLALADLRAHARATLEAFPLGDVGTVTLDLTRFDPFAAGAHLEIVEAGGVRSLALPDRAYFRGAVRGRPESRALLIATPDTVQGLVSVDGALRVIGSDGQGGHRGYALADVDPAAYMPPRALCATPPILAPHAHEAAAAPPTARTAIHPRGTLKIADLAIDTDQELRAKFASDDDALAYLAALIAAVNVIYERDLDVRLSVAYLRLWGADTADPWTKSDPTDAVYEMYNVWNNPFGALIGVQRDLAEMISGKTVHGGSSFPSELCDWYSAYGVSQVYGAFDLSDPLGIWDVLNVAHEIGHTMGSTHTHCYDPPVDHCFNLESGCWSGAAELPASGQGTIMSYCYLHPGGLANMSLDFGATVATTIKAFVASQQCLAAAPADPVCGNGVVESGEQCDDGGTSAGDCCDAACQFESAVTACADDGNACSDDQCDGNGACVHPANTAPCDDGSACTDDDVCSAGTCAGTTVVVCDPCLACTAEGGCAVPSVDACEPAVPKKSQLVIKNRTPDGKDSLAWKWKGVRPITKTSFGAPTVADALTFCVYDQTGGTPTVRLAAQLPVGGDCGGKPCWKEKRAGFTFADKAAAHDGLVRALLTAGGAGHAAIGVAGKGAALAVPTGPLVAPVVVRLERAAGGCFTATYDAPRRNDMSEFRAVAR